MDSTSDNIDRLSCLHEEVLSHILSLMPTKFAVRTSILSKRWRYHWTLVNNLDFDDIHPVHGLYCFTNFVNRVLALCKTSHVNLFRLHCSEIWVRKVSLSKWINEAVRLNVRELDIQVILLHLPLPLSMFNCKTLTKLRIVWGTHDWDVWEFPSSVKLPCLKVLEISVFSKPSINAFRLISGCPILESLSLDVDYPNEEEDYKFNIPTLKRLKLRTRKSIILNKVVLNVPNLEYLFVGGVVSSLFVMEDLSSLVEATATVSVFDERFNHLKLDLLKGISGAKSISWSASTVDVPLNSSVPKFPNLKHLELKSSFSSGWLSLFQFLESASELEHLCIEEPEESPFMIKQKREESCWIEPQSVPTCLLSNLRTMKITRCKGRKCDIKFLKYMLGNAEVLKTLTITCENVPLKEEMCAELLKFPRASRYCEIHFIGNGSYSAGN